MTPTEFKDWRAAMGWTQAEAGEQLGKTRESIARYETAANLRSHRPVTPTIAILCESLSDRR